ncbi:hypothetical protein DPEC_G00073950 [Dallia pectoralis]|uniref:Uncharacterized protein n=1 Tax=Dallia pectoralis TaxID=75939 RepID=A0ACC2H2Y8_DALPE|nr:hypothetical protein DPEC_G00073950 [Dallia pectoralis]
MGVNVAPRRHPLCCHNGASTVFNGSNLPPQRPLFTHCHHSRPSLPQNVMVSEGPFYPIVLGPLCPLPVGTPDWRDGPVSGARCLTSELLQRSLLRLCFGAPSPLPRRIRPRSAHGETEPLGVSLFSNSLDRQVGLEWTLAAAHTPGTKSTQSDSSYWERNAFELKERFKEANQ